MKDTLEQSHKRYRIKLNLGIIAAFFLFLGGLAFSISKLTAAPENEELIAGKTVKGMVLSQDKKPIPGAIIIVKETTTGTVTDIKGNFSLDLKSFEEENLTIKISMIDYESTEVIVKKSELPLNVGKITLNKEAE